jgi:hypothetical protein
MKQHVQNLSSKLRDPGDEMVLQTAVNGTPMRWLRSTCEILGRFLNGSVSKS